MESIETTSFVEYNDNPNKRDEVSTPSSNSPETRGTFFNRMTKRPLK